MPIATICWPGAPVKEWHIGLVGLDSARLVSMAASREEAKALLLLCSGVLRLGGWLGGGWLSVPPALAPSQAAGPHLITAGSGSRLWAG